jgi:lipopolysaccharide export system protein LptA
MTRQDRSLPVRLTALLLALWPMAAMAQTDITLGGLSADPGAPIEVAAENLTVDQATGVAVYSGNVVIGQGAMRIAAERVELTLNAETGDIARLVISGQVTFVTATEAAEAATATYDLTTGSLVMEGSVLLTQGASAISADRMVINVESGTAQMQGNVRTVFQQADP